ncbi:uncharacterized protein THITE_2055098 [Thermothielavioides terrestris NRRL 8126]|uniref:FAD-binding PCMH-type domain-containing protein n=1 Tax=Thermothielavioides terrestris (strain ATCC 38088 / NRRL 8126) TaxID=578455 RepID=G2R8U6_THETT|nr:uncharacterized protein THITE_2055098 [Thermothielavioides terrestris NRRL 8126]AEO68595.1 hypothetical protein THITE_2055098 [Thermothielavioides terrestris NRRL 8126]
MTAAHTAASNVNINLEALFGPHVSSGTLIASASDANFSSVVGPRWSSWQPPQYFGAIKPANEADLQAIIKIAKAHNVSFHATTSGHGTNMQYGKIKNALNINLGNFKSVSIDTANNRLTIGGATSFGDVFGPLWAAGKEVQTGNSVCVGMVGATIGGGIGSMQGLHGLMVDALESVRMVTASGEVVTASETENPDLFWAVRGAGANFGIITSATYRVFDQTANGSAILAEFVYPAAANRSVWELLQSYDNNLPRPLALFPEVGYNRTTNEPMVLYVAIYFGTLEEAQPHFDKARALGPVSTTIVNTTAPGVYTMLSQGVCDNGNYQNEYTVGLQHTDVATMEDVFADMVAFYEANPEYNGKVIYQRYSNEVALQTPVAKTAYPWRDIKTYLLFENIYTNPALDDAVTSFSEKIRDKIQATSGYPNRRVYLNYDHGDEGPAAWWGADHLRKLRALKAKWDPDNLFGKGAPMN